MVMKCQGTKKRCFNDGVILLGFFSINFTFTGLKIVARYTEVIVILSNVFMKPILNPVSLFV